MQKGLTLGQFGAIALAFVIVSIILSMGGEILNQVQSQQTSNSVAYNITEKGLEGAKTFGDWASYRVFEHHRVVQIYQNCINLPNRKLATNNSSRSRSSCSYRCYRNILQISGINDRSVFCNSRGFIVRSPTFLFVKSVTKKNYAYAY